MRKPAEVTRNHLGNLARPASADELSLSKIDRHAFSSSPSCFCLHSPWLLLTFEENERKRRGKAGNQWKSSSKKMSRNTEPAPFLQDRITFQHLPLVVLFHSFYLLHSFLPKTMKRKSEKQKQTRDQRPRSETARNNRECCPEHGFLLFLDVHSYPASIVAHCFFYFDLFFKNVRTRKKKPGND